MVSTIGYLEEYNSWILEKIRKVANRSKKLANRNKS